MTIADEVHRTKRQLEALTLAARDFGGRAEGARQRAGDIRGMAVQIAAWSVAPPQGDAPAAIAALGDPPTARMLAHKLRSGHSWQTVAAAAKEAAREAAEAAGAREAEYEQAEALRQAAEARLLDLAGDSA